jgi:hypothetical protein
MWCAIVAVKTVAVSMSAGLQQNPVTVPSSPASGNGTRACDVPAVIASEGFADPAAAKTVSSHQRMPTPVPRAVGNSSTAAPGR